MNTFNRKNFDYNIKIFIVLPAFNEGYNLPVLFENLEFVLKKLSRLGYEREYIVVDDGSSDETPHILKERKKVFPINILTHHNNLGLGDTIRDGLKWASENASPSDIIFTMDSDNTQPPGLMIPMVQKILEGNDVVIASRYRFGSRVIGLSKIRSLLSFGARILFSIVFPIPGVRDYTCGYRAYTARSIQLSFNNYGDDFIEHKGFQCMADILLRMKKLKFIMTEVPMVLRYDIKKGESKMKVGTTVLQTLKLLIQRRFTK